MSDEISKSKSSPSISHRDTSETFINKVSGAAITSTGVLAGVLGGATAGALGGGATGAAVGALLGPPGAGIGFVVGFVGGFLTGGAGGAIATKKILKMIERA